LGSAVLAVIPVTFGSTDPQETPMRTVTAALFASVDGVVESPNLFQFDHFDDDMGPLMDQALAGVDEVVMGRVTYDEWSNYWPQAPAGDFGDFINPITKYVASRTLTGALSWATSRSFGSSSSMGLSTRSP
jgi:dihydrofolate reductase